MNFSTMPTAAASVRPRWLAMIVMMRKADLHKAVLREHRKANAQDLPHDGLLRTEIRLCSEIMRRLRMASSAMRTLSACESVVPRAAPAGPMCSAPMKK